MTPFAKTFLVATAVAGIAAPAFAEDISFWGWRVEDVPQYEEFIDTFEAENPDINVNLRMIEAVNYGTILSTALAGEAGPDAMMVRAYGSFESVASGGYLMPLSEENVPALKDFPADALKAETLRADNTVYAIPFASQTMMVLYNKDVFSELGLEPPKTWDDMKAAAEALQEAGLYAFANGTADAWQNEVITFGLGSSTMGKAFYEDVMSGDADFTDPRFVDALTRIKDMSQYFPDGFIGLDYASSQQLFATGMAGMFVGGSYEIAAMKGMNPDINIGAIPAPVVNEDDEGLVAVFYDGGYAGNAATEHKDAVLKFLNFLASKEFGQAFANELSNISPIPGVTFDNPDLEAVAELNKTSMPYMMLVNFRFDQPSGSTLVQENVQKMMAGEATPEEVGATVTEGLSKYYEPFQNN
ncbi:MAG: sugar ABC transporter substrate-binding protein [Martelella sp.]|uniref:extracellular solute-binding protein n=1 Tax=unclassified Martelella TaxID=2629616 RepID=UPI000C41EA62|nr:extracellular solute-binding protein [Martelella sp.]MAU19896.1 sugar ABC transporter substrate-binding protein [Martelella sp.]|tara:strand:+ start:623 stop:1864 length:1242 start_codon:yes stop_codon:yes gene_type:complete